MDGSWIPLAIWTAVLAIPLWFLVARTGLSRWWGAVSLVPIVGGAVVLWVVAFKRWPNGHERGRGYGLSV